MMARKRKFQEFPAVQVVEDTWYVLDNPGADECCDCGLVHRTEFKLEGDRIYWRTKRDDKQTAVQRKLRGIKLSEKAPAQPDGDATTPH